MAKDQMKDRLLDFFSGFTIIFIGLIMLILGSIIHSDLLFGSGIFFFLIIPTIVKLINIFG